MFADCLVYYRRDIRAMSSADAIRLAERLPNYWQVVPDSKPLRVLSSVYAAQEANRAEQIMTTAELASTGVLFEEV